MNCLIQIKCLKSRQIIDDEQKEKNIFGITFCNILTNQKYAKIRTVARTVE